MTPTYWLERVAFYLSPELRFVVASYTHVLGSMFLSINKPDSNLLLHFDVIFSLCAVHSLPC